MNPTTRPTVPMNSQQALRIMQIFCGAMIVTVLVLGVVLFFVQKPVLDTHLFTESLHEPKQVFLFFAGVVALLIRVPLTNTILLKGLEEKQPQNLEAALPIYFAVFNMRNTLAEAAALMGFVATFLSGEASPYVILTAGALVALLKDFPSHEKMKAKLKAVRPQLQL